MIGLILFLQAFSTGILAPLLSLTLLSKGITMTELAMAMGLFSLTAALLELPSGILADLFGRKKTFLLAQPVTLASVLCILHGSLIPVCFGAVLLGTSRALSSGTLDALYIDTKAAELGMRKAVAHVHLLDGAGLAAGAILGGFLPLLSGRVVPGANIYDAGLFLRLLLTIIIAGFTAFCMKDNRERNTEKPISLANHIKEGSAVIAGNRQLLMIFVCVFSSGFLLISLETYWQPAFITLPTASTNLWLLGVISFLFFGASSAGTLAAEFLTKHLGFQSRTFYLFSRLLLAGSVLALAISRRIPTFAFFLITHYFFLGSSNLTEGVLIHHAIPSDKRASILSLSSLILQSGVLAGSILGGILIDHCAIGTFWSIGAVLVIFTTAAFGLVKPQTSPEALHRNHYCPMPDE